MPVRLRALMIARRFVLVKWEPPTASFRGLISGYNITASDDNYGVVIYSKSASSTETTANVTGKVWVF